MTDRKCAWCGADISGRSRGAKWCSKSCGRKAGRAADPERHRAYVRKYRDKVRPKTGPFRELRCCEWCADQYLAKTSTAKFCSTKCKESARYRARRDKRCEQARRRRAEKTDHVRALGRASYYRMKEERPDAWQKFCEDAKAASKRWRASNPEYARQKDREWKRRRDAERALSLLLLPMQTPPET